MGVEIERKFLVASDAWRSEQTIDVRSLKQGYLLNGTNTTVRIRTDGISGYLTVKSGTSLIRRAEYEFAIPLKDAEEMLDLCGKTLAKTRTRLMHDGLVWEVDQFAGHLNGLVIVEVELTTEDQHISLPSWVGAEVTSNPVFANNNLINADPWT